MSEEKIVEKKECDCFCKNEAVRKIAIVATGTFIGAFLALSLFSALNKPPMPCPCHKFMPPMHMYKQFRHQGDFRGFEKKFPKEFKGEMNGKNMPKPEADD